MTTLGIHDEVMERQREELLRMNAMTRGEVYVNRPIVIITCAIAFAPPVITVPHENLHPTETVNISPATVSELKGPSVCPDDMVEVEGEFCPHVEQACLQWVDIRGNPTDDPKQMGPEVGRCGTFQYPTKCLSVRKVHLHFCIDRFEFPGIAGQRPRSWMTWYDAKRELEALGKRMCTDSEWTFAAEGPDMHPYLYGDGYHRDRHACNTDNFLPKGLNVFKATSKNTPEARALDDMLEPSGTRETCVSPFGVHDMVGNIDELVVNESGRPYRSGLKGGHVQGVRGRCRPITIAHGPTFSWYETGTRGCASLSD